jgi:hypothetical protein
LKTCVKNLFLLPALVAGLGLILAAPAQAPYTFGPQVQSTNTASITYNSETSVFQYTNVANLSNDFAGLPLTGNAAAFITTSNGWTASLTANLAARSMPGNGSAVNAAMGLFVVINDDDNDTVRISLNQENNTGSGDNNNFYGTVVIFQAVTNGQNLATTPLSGSGSFDGFGLRVFSGGEDASPTTETINAASGALTLSNEASTGTLTGYYNGSPVGSISLAS